MKTIINNQECTVKMPTQFNADELKALQDAACQQHLAAPGTKTFTIVESSFMQICQRMASLIKDGYEHDTHGYHSINPFVIPFVKKQEEIDRELEAVKADVESRYKAKIAAEVELAKANLIAQRRATLERKERERQEKVEQKLMDELEKEAAELFDSYLSFD